MTCLKLSKRPQDAPTEIDHLTKQIRNRHYKLNRPKNMFYWITISKRYYKQL